jgi:hypothetical protein
MSLLPSINRLSATC